MERTASTSDGLQAVILDVQLGNGASGWDAGADVRVERTTHIDGDIAHRRQEKQLVQIKIPLQRAFELARSGKFGSIADIRSQMGKEGYPTEQMSGGSLLRQLREVIKAAVKR